MRKWTKEETEDIIHLYTIDGLSINTIRTKYKVRDTAISNLLKDNNIQIRRKGTTKNLFLKEDYFSNIDTSNKAYLLGFIFTDGSVSYRRNGTSGTLNIEVNEKDREILNFLQSELNTNNRLVYRDSKNTLSIKIVSKKIVDDLAKFKIVPNKTYNINSLPDNVPEEYKIDFIRGMLDGDGSIYKTGDKWGISFTGYSFQLVTEFQQLVNNFIEKNNVLKVGKTSAYRFQWMGKNDVYKIAKLLYDNNNFALTRKRKLAMAILDEYKCD